MDEPTAAQIALGYYNKSRPPDEELVLMPDSSIRKPYGWVFQLQSRSYLETGDMHAMLVGLGPTVVLDDGRVHTLGTARPQEEEIYAFEVARGLPITRDGPSTSRLGLR